MDVQLKKRKKEQERQKRERLVLSKAKSQLPSQAPHSLPPQFGTLIKRTDSHDELGQIAKDVLGPYDKCQAAMRSMNINQQLQLLGTFHTAPSTPVNSAIQNPFDHQFNKMSSGLVTSAESSSSGSVSTSHSTSSTTSISQLGRHAVAEPPAPVKEREKGERSKLQGRGESGQQSSGTKSSKHSSDPSSAAFPMPKPKKRSKPSQEGSADSVSRPTNVLVVKKSKEKGRVRPYKAVGSPTGNQQGPTVTNATKKPTGPTQGATVDLFKVEPDRGLLGPALHPPGPAHTHTPTPPIPKKPKKHSHRTPSTFSVTDQSSSPLPSSARKPNPVYTSTSVTPAPSPSSSSSTSALQRHGKSSTNTLPSLPHPTPPPPSIPPSPATLPLKKHSSSGTITSAHPPHLPQTSSVPSQSEKEREKSSASSRLGKHPMNKSLSHGDIVSGPRRDPTVGDHSSASLSSSVGGAVLDEKLEKRKKKKVKKERDRDRERDKEKVREKEKEREREREREKRTERVGNGIMKEEAQDAVAEFSKQTSFSSMAGKAHLQSSNYSALLSHVMPVQSQQQSLPSNSPLTSQSHVTSHMTGHVRSVNRAEKQSKQRPRRLSIETHGDMEETSTDAGDVQHLLKELMCNVSIPPIITPLPTPKNRTSSTFTFPQQAASLPVSTTSFKYERVPEALPTGHTHTLSESGSDSSDSDSSSESSSESSDSEEEDARVKGEEQGREASMAMEEDSTTPGWDKVLPSVLDTITPLKKTPPHLPNAFTSPLAEMAANLSPPHSAISVSSTSSGSSVGSFSRTGFILGTYAQAQSSTGSSLSSVPASFSTGQPIYSQASMSVDGPTELSGVTSHLGLTSQVAFEEAASSSDSGEDSGSESDDESSDLEDHSSGEEDAAQATQQQEPGAKLSSSSSVSLAGDDTILFHGENSIGFFDPEFLSGLQEDATKIETGGGAMSNPAAKDSHWLAQTHSFQPLPMEEGVEDIANTTAHQRMEDNIFPESLLTGGLSGSDLSHPAPVSASSTAPATSVMTASLPYPTGGKITHPPKDLARQSSRDGSIPIDATHSILSQQGSLDSISGRKRRLEHQEHLPHDITFDLQPPAQKAPRTALGEAPSKRRRESSLSSFSVSSESSSDSSDSSDEEGEAVPTFASQSPNHPPPPSAPSLLSSQAPPPDVPTATPVAVQPTQHVVAPLVCRGVVHPQQQLEAGELVEGEEGEEEGEGEELWVKIPLQKVEHGREKPKAKVEPYNVTAPNKTPRRRSTVDSANHEDLSRISGRHGDHDSRNLYSRPRERDDDHHPQYSREYRRDEGRRPHRGSGWESGRDREPWGRHGMRGNRSRDRDREREHYRRGDWEDYGPYDDSRPRSRNHPPTRTMTAEDFLREARKRKHDADKTRTPGIEKAKAYLESVIFFMRHGDAIEETQPWDGAQTKNPFRLYSDTITMMKYCQAWAGECKPLVALCLRCVSALYWKLFLLKQTTASNIQKDLQEFFLPSKGTQKSPYLSSFSPIPSPASVGSTASTGSVGGVTSSGPTQDPSPSSSVTVPKLIFSKAADHLSITSYLHQSFELWKQSTIIIEQYRDFFSILDRRCRITQFSPLSVVADWLEMGARNVRYRS